MKGWACCALICHQQKRTFGGWRISSRDFASHFRVSYDILCSSWKRPSPCFQYLPTTVVVLTQPSQRIHTSREKQTFRRRFPIPYVSPRSSSPCWRTEEVVSPPDRQKVQSLMRNNYIPLCTAYYTLVQQSVLLVDCCYYGLCPPPMEQQHYKQTRTTP